ncbi:MAG: Stk1 family PASTA domain-containing Ser/Thr kinase [Thermoleophilaceae bacterium]|nr:Stk1 family PASTA domain-containing Ser/Thr kinase [Thermoleophilaceae bacterium]
MLTEGTLLDNRYRVVQRVGTGGMADVYLAEDTHLNRRVAVKVMHDRFAQDPEFVKRFEREASAAAGLQHKNVVGIYDRGLVDNMYFIVMEYLDGQTLKEIISAQGPLQPLQAIGVTEQILAAAKFAHQRDVIHRDFKPQNVIVDREGNIKVTDFGIAYQPASDVTQAGAMLGTAQYISPEQAQGKTPVAASDLYSIGAMLFELLTGRVPFTGDSSVAIALQHISAPPPRPSAYNPAVPQALDDVVLRAMAKDPNLRYRSADEFLLALKQAAVSITSGLAAGGQTEIQTAPLQAAALPAQPTAEDIAKKNRRRAYWIGGGLALLAAIAAAFFLLTAPAQVTVPYVIGSSLDDAQAKLVTAKLTSTSVKKRDVAPAGEVIAQDPSRGAVVDEGTSVLLTVSSGPGTVVVPDVKDLPEDRAIEKLQEVGLKAKVQGKNSSKVDKGSAISTVPKKGENAERGSTVDLFISDGPKQVKVPSVVGDSIDVAKGKLKDAGFEVEVTTRTSEKPEDEVIEQTPAAAAEADDGSTVKLVVASGFNTVPSVIDLTLEEATAKLQKAGFEVDYTEVNVTDADLDGKVQTQNPNANTQAKVGSTIKVEVGLFSGG